MIDTEFAFETYKDLPGRAQRAPAGCTPRPEWCDAVLRFVGDKSPPCSWLRSDPTASQALIRAAPAAAARSAAPPIARSRIDAVRTMDETLRPLRASRCVVRERSADRWGRWSAVIVGRVHVMDEKTKQLPAEHLARRRLQRVSHGLPSGTA